MMRHKYAAQIAAVVRLTHWPLDYIMWGVSVRALVALSVGLAETAPKLHDSDLD